jgi:hypothetical protein
LPHYLVRTRGLKGLAIYAGLVAVLLLAVVLAIVATAFVL